MKDRYYFIAIGGIGMSGLAKYLLEDGFEVLGSDISESKNTAALEKLGAKIFIGHQADNLPDNCTVVASTAIKEDNPELKKAKALGLEILHRSDLLAKIANGVIGSKKEYFIGFSGTHGKTTTSGLASYVLEKSDLDSSFKPSFVVGGIVPEIATNAKAGAEKFFVAELDESDGTIIKYQPEISVINNLEVDHVDFYTDGMSAILKTFNQYLSALPKDAKVLINIDDSGNRTLIEQNPEIDFITFALDGEADYTVKNVDFTCCETRFDVYNKGEFLISMKTQLLGKHNVYNALAVLASLNEAGVDLSKTLDAFYNFTGMGKRFQISAKFDGICIYDDYAHHPTEIKATLTAAQSLSDKRIIAVFQPHRFSRLQGLWDDFLTSFDGVDVVYVTDVYSASESPIEGVSAEKFTEELLKRLNIPCIHLPGDIKNVAETLLPDLKKNDIVIGLGAGSITNLGKELLHLKEQSSEAN